MAEAARIVADMGAVLIDINMGCPAKKVVGGMSGSALLREPDLALRLIEAVTGAVDVPVTLKTRLGGMVTVSIRRSCAARRRCRRTDADPSWTHAATVLHRACRLGGHRRVRAGLSIPVIANGDITGPDEAAAALRLSGAAGVMVGRGAQGAPWRLAQIAHAIYGAPVPVVPHGPALVDMVRGHHEAMLSFYGLDLGLKVARKHLGWYMDRAGTAASLRGAVLTAATPGAVHALLPDAILGGMEAAA